MRAAKSSWSTVTAILPRRYLTRVVDAVTSAPGSSALVWDARGTLLREHWTSSFFPAISPAKEVMQLLVPDYEVKRVVHTIVEAGRLHQQATGAVFCTGCDEVIYGDDFHRWPTDQREHPEASHNLRENLDVIYCIVEADRTRAITTAAIRAGAHGPVVYFGEGRGLRDRLGWLRITKQQSKEVITVIAESSDAEHVFAAMAKAGQLHLPGRGFMFRVPVEIGMFNLPSRLAHRHHTASMQQIINTIDHLAGHTHWRDQEVFSTGSGAQAAGIDMLHAQSPNQREPQRVLTGIVLRRYVDGLVDVLLDAGAAGVNVSHARFSARDGLCDIAGARINLEYSLLRCVTSERLASALLQIARLRAQESGIEDLCLFTQAVAETATYIPGARDFRAA